VSRRDQISANLARVRTRIVDACARTGRDPAQVTLVAVTKTFPATDVLHLAALGVREIGENRDQEAAGKAREVAAAGVSVRWHFVGQLQRNKCRSVATYADVVHSVDSVRLAQALQAASDRSGRRDGVPIEVLVQVSLDGDPVRGGAIPNHPAIPAGPREADRDLDRVLEAVASADGLRLGGVMAIAPLADDPGRAFTTLAEIADRVRGRYPDAIAISAGMSDDLEAAIDHGATHVRIGSALLGKR
jgi:pyridoxal phosphate enzyme (YggS family)